MRTLLCVALILISPAAFGIRLYQIGGEYTWQTNPDAILSHPEIVGGYHINENATLEEIWQNKSTTTQTSPTPYGQLYSALQRNKWDAITYQLKEAPNNTMADELVSLYTLKDLAVHSRLARHIIIAPWYDLSKIINYSPLDDYIDPNNENNPERDFTSLFQPSLHNEVFYDKFMETVSAISPGQFSIVPINAVFLRIRQDILNGTAPQGLNSIADFYSGETTLSPLGQYAANQIVLSVILERNSAAIPAAGYSDCVVSSEMNNYIGDTAWDVITNDIYSGITDLDNNNIADSIPEPAGLFIVVCFLFFVKRSAR